MICSVSDSVATELNRTVARVLEGDVLIIQILVIVAFGVSVDLSDTQRIVR